MLEYLQLAGFATSIVAFLLSAISMGLHYAKRGEHPLVAPLKSQIDSIQLTQADIIDRVEHWMKRDRVRKLREGAEEAQSASTTNASLPELPLSPQALDKSQLRQIARAKGMRA
jgi:hypothetical protein